MRAIIKQKCPGAFSTNILFKPKKTISNHMHSLSFCSPLGCKAVKNKTSTKN